MASSVEPLAEFTIVRPNKAQQEAALRAQFVPWNRGLTWEKFAELDAATSKEDWIVEGGEQAWVLVKRDDPEGEIYSSCGTYRRNAFIKHPGSDKYEQVVTYGIQSVVTPVQHHRNGYARHLLKLLHYVIGSPDGLPPFPSAWGQPPTEVAEQVRSVVPAATAAFLWSDVGPTFYEKCTIGEKLPGYVMETDNNRSIVWDVLPASADSGQEWEWLYESDMPKLRAEFSEITKRQLAETQVEGDRPVVRTDPANKGTLSFLPLRAFAQGSLDPEERKRHPFGMRRRDPASGEETVVICTSGLGAIYGRLCITLHRNLRPEHLSSLLAKMDELAPIRGTKQGQIWGLQPESELARAFGELKERNANPHIREGMDAHLLAVASYLPNGQRVDFQDSQIWNWC